MRRQGTLNTWKDDRGFGFISPDRGGGEIFVHVSAFAGSRRPEGGERLSYELSQNAQGKPRAVAVAFADSRPVRGRARASREPSVPMAPVLGACVVAIAFLAIVVGLAIDGRLPALVVFGYVIVSLVTMLAYAFDKSAAMGGRWRTAEQTLHLFALAGGWPGALVAQRLFRHKARKISFQMAFWMTVAGNLAVLGYLLFTTS